MRNTAILVIFLCLSACTNKQPAEVVRSTASAPGADRGQNTGASSGGVQPDSDGINSPDIGVMEEELPIEERAFNKAANGDFTLLESLVINFEYDSTRVDSRYHKVLETHARFLELYPQVSVSIAGHCDERGAPEYNMALGQRRANGVADYLKTLNVSRQQLSNIHSFGSNRPLALGSSEADYAQNRRVEISYQVN